MSANIFISYSRDDERHALHLLSALRREGYSVWIDQESIAGASIWSDEIVQNIKNCEIFIALLSAASVASPNVGKEIALAAEHAKIILPIEIGSVTLPGRLEYALAGIQRTNHHDEEAILHAVRSQVARLEGSSEVSAPVHSKTRMQRAIPKVLVSLVLVLAAGMFLFFRRTTESPMAPNSVAVLPFSTLNLDRDSTRNLDIFSEALLTRIAAMNMLSPVSSNTSSAYKESRLNAEAIANELKTRFIIEGIVRKTHDVNFVSVRITDSKKGGEIWEQSYSGNNSELFSIRERVTNDLTGYLQAVIGTENEIHSAEINLASHPNDAAAYGQLATFLLPSDKNRSIDLLNTAIKLDSGNIAYYLSAGIVAERAGMDARPFGRIAVELCRQRMPKYPDSIGLCGALGIALELAGSHSEAERIYDSLLRIDPHNVRINYNAACCFAKQGKADSAVSILQNLFTFAPGKRMEVQSDPDFDGIRTSPQYQKLMYGLEQ